MQLAGIRTNVDFINAIRDGKIAVRINHSKRLFTITHFWHDDNGDIGTIVCSCGNSLSIFKYDNELVLDIEHANNIQ